MKRVPAISGSGVADANDSYSCGIITLFVGLFGFF